MALDFQLAYIRLNVFFFMPISKLYITLLFTDFSSTADYVPVTEPSLS